MKLAKVKSEKEFYKKFPTEEHFFKAHPMARYGYALKADGGTPMNLNGPQPPGERSRTEYAGGTPMELNGPQPIQNPQGLPTRDIEAGIYKSGDIPQQNVYQAQKQYDMSMPVQGQPGNVPGSGPSGMADAMDDPNEPNQPGTPPDMGGNNNKGLSKRQQAGQRFKQGAAKVGQWAGEHAGDLWAGATQALNMAIPQTPVRQNVNPYQMAINTNPQGTGSHAAAKNGTKMKKGKYAADGTQMPQQPLNWDNFNDFHADQSRNNPQYGTDTLNHGNFNNEALSQWNTVHPAQAIQPNDISRYQQEGNADPTVRKQFGPSNIKGILGSKTTGYSKMEHQYEHYAPYTAPGGERKYGLVDQKDFRTDANKANQYIASQQPRDEYKGFGDPTQDVNYKAPGQVSGFSNPSQPTAVQPQGLKATGFPTYEQSKQKYNERKASGKKLPSNYFTGKSSRQSGDPIGDVRMGNADEAYTGTKMFPDSINRGKRNTYFDDPVKSIHMAEGGALSPEDAAISKVLMERNRGKNFVDRAFSAGNIQKGHIDNGTKEDDKYELPSLPNSSVAAYPSIRDPQNMGGYQSHRMSYSTGEKYAPGKYAGPYRVYPDIVQDKSGRLKNLGRKAEGYAEETGEYIEAPTQHAADALSNYGYKKATGIPTYANGGYMKMDAGGFSNTPIHVQGPAEYLSLESIELHGKSHAAHGQKIYANGTHVEAEGPNGDGTGVGEIVANEPRTGTPHVLGNLRTLPETAMKLAEMGVKVGNNMKHKEVGEIIAKAERNNDKIQTKVNYLLNTNQPGANYQGPSFNSGKVLADIHAQNKVKTDTAKQLVMDDMNMQNDIAEKMGMDPKKVGNYMKDAQKLSAKYGVKMAAGGSLYQPLQITPAMPTQHSQITPLYDIAPMTTRKDWANDGSAGGKPRSYITKSPTTVPGDMIFAAKGAKVPAAQRDNTPLTAQDIAEFEDLRKSNPEMFTEDYGQGRKNAKLPGEGKLALWGPGYRNVKEHAGKYTQTPNPPDYMSVAYPPYIVPVGDDNPHITVPEVDWNNREKLNTQPGPDVSMLKNPNVELNKYTPAQRPTTHKGIRNRAGITDYLPEIMSAFDQIEPVQSLQARTNLEDTYTIDFQNEINDVNRSYDTAIKAAANNPGAQATLLAQKSEDLGKIHTKAFQYNQQNQGGIRGRNIERLDKRDAMNLQLDSQKLDRQAAAKEAHSERIFGAASSISKNEPQRRAQNWMLGADEKATGYIIQDKDGNYHRITPDHEYAHDGPYGISSLANDKSTTETKSWKDPKTGETWKKVTKDDGNNYYGGYMMSGGAMGGMAGGTMAMRGPSYFGVGGADTKKKKKRKS